MIKHTLSLLYHLSFSEVEELINFPSFRFIIYTLLKPAIIERILILDYPDLDMRKFYEGNSKLNAKLEEAKKRKDNNKSIESSTINSKK